MSLEPAAPRPGRGKHRSSRQVAPGAARRFRAESLFRNSTSLILNLVVSAACGYGGVSLLTRLYSVQAVGLSATAISVGGLITFVTQFGVNYSLPRFLPTSKQRSALINTVLTVTCAAALLGSLIFLALPVADKLYALGGGLFVLAFIIATCVDTAENVLETVLVADRSADIIAKGNSIPNVIKLAAPPALMFFGALGAYIARFASDIFALVVFGVVLLKRGHRFRLALNTVATRDVRRFSFQMYGASLVGSLPLMVLPIIILTRFGASQIAYWSVAMSMATLLFQLPGAIGQALLPEVAHRPAERRHLLGRAAWLTCVIVTPVLAIAYVAAPLGLAIFGRHYVIGALGVLRWLIIAVLITMMNYVTGTILYLAKKTLVIAIINVVDAVIVIGLATTWAHDAQGVAISWAIGDVGNTLLFSLAAAFAVYQVRGRWADLGRPVGAASADDSIAAEPTKTSQMQALEVLLELARLQGQGAFYNSRGVTEPLPRFTLEAYEAEQARRRSGSASQIGHDPHHLASARDVHGHQGQRSESPGPPRPNSPEAPSRNSAPRRPGARQ